MSSQSVCLLRLADLALVHPPPRLTGTTLGPTSPHPKDHSGQLAQQDKWCIARTTDGTESNGHQTQLSQLSSWQGRNAYGTNKCKADLLSEQTLQGRVFAVHLIPSKWQRHKLSSPLLARP